MAEQRPDVVRLLPLVLMSSALLMALLAVLFWTATVDVGDVGRPVAIVLGVVACAEMGMALFFMVRTR
jgi:hypothetical protein